MKHSDIFIADLKTIEDCDKAIYSIERDPSNCDGDYFSGYEADLKKGAQNKIEAIGRKSDKIWQRMIKENPYLACD